MSGHGFQAGGCIICALPWGSFSPVASTAAGLAEAIVSEALIADFFLPISNSLALNLHIES